MKHIFLSLLYLFFLSCSKEKEPELPLEEIHTKTANFLVFAKEDFSDPGFDNLQVSIQLSVTKVSRKDKVIIARLWDSTYSQRPIKEYPYPEAKAIKVSKQFTGIKDSTELVKAVYSMQSQRGAQQPSYTSMIYNFEKGNKTLHIKVTP
ncbi:MAG TPA: hypothetical protein VGN63_00330 [Flavisolibacter sp.]|jgi:hypothetical protein|nr:hypothetical protein [Flavisolibacter sp.]